jgi:hypothetical protein
MRRGLPIKRVLAAIFALLMLAAFNCGLNAQAAWDRDVFPYPSFSYNKLHEITVKGTVRAVDTQAVIGSPFGVHLLLASETGVIDAILGPFLQRETVEALHNGIPVQIVGSLQDFRGRSYLLARQLNFQGNSVRVRNENGFLVRPQSPRGARSDPQLPFEKNPRAQPNGAAR